MAGGQARTLRLSEEDQKEDQKLELVKDVTALANGGGGVIVLGYETCREPTTARDLVVKLRPIPCNLVDQDQYRQVVESLTYPPIRDLAMRWWLLQNNAGVFTIRVAAVAEDNWPVILTKARSEGSRRVLLLGVFQRSDDRVTSLLPAEVHADIRIGRLLRRTGLPGLTPGFFPSPSEPSGPSPQERAARLASDTADAQLAGRRRYSLQAWPRMQVKVRDLHAPGTHGLRYILTYPPKIRPNGFGLPTRVQPSDIAGGGLRVLTERQSLSLQTDGLLTWVASAASDFLAWADDRRGRKHGINQLALVESTLEFVRLYVLQVLPRCEPQPSEWVVAGGMADLHEAGERTALAPGEARLFQPTYDWREAPSNNITIRPISVREDPPGSVAFKILKQIYMQFGIGESKIPYTVGQSVSEQEIANVSQSLI